MTDPDDLVESGYDAFYEAWGTSPTLRAIWREHGGTGAATMVAWFFFRLFTKPRGFKPIVVTGSLEQCPTDSRTSGVQVFEAGAAGHLAWSPDGRWLAVPAGDGIHLIDTHGDTAPVALEVGPAEDQYLLILSSG